MLSLRFHCLCKYKCEFAQHWFFTQIKLCRLLSDIFQVLQAFSMHLLLFSRALWWRKSEKYEVSAYW